MKSIRCILGIHDLYKIRDEFIYFYKTKNFKLIANYVCLRCGKIINNIDYYNKKEDAIRDKLLKLQLDRYTRAKEFLGKDFKEDNI